MNVDVQEYKFQYEKSYYITFTKKGNGPFNIVFLHGFGASKNSWEEIVPFFDSTEYTLYLIDLKGFGNSSIPKDNKYSLNDNAAIITKFINSKIENNYILIGHSYGGAVSLILASSKRLKIFPQLLILLDCPAYNIETPFFITYLSTPIFNKMMYVLTSSKMRAIFSLKRIVANANYSQKMVDRYIDSYKGKGKSYSFITTANQISPSNYKELIESYENITIPTLIIWGAEDRILSLKQGEMLSKQIKNSKLEIVADCGHIPQEEKPMETYEKIISFIKDL